MAGTITVDALCLALEEMFFSHTKIEGVRGMDHYGNFDENYSYFKFSDPTENYLVTIDARDMGQHKGQSGVIRLGEQDVTIELQLELQKELRGGKATSCVEELEQYLNKLELVDIRHDKCHIDYNGNGLIAVHELYLFPKLSGKQEDDITSEQFAASAFRLQKEIGDIFLKSTHKGDYSIKIYKTPAGEIQASLYGLNGTRKNGNNTLAVFNGVDYLFWKKVSEWVKSENHKPEYNRLNTQIDMAYILSKRNR